MNILEKIVATTCETVTAAKAVVSVEELRARAMYGLPRRDFIGAIREKRDAQVPEQTPSLIAEVKKASPSKGLIRPDFDPVAIAKDYRDAGAACISVLTDEPYFQGKLEYLAAVRAEVENAPPLLRKDFIIDEYQIEEARAHGADAILLIVSILDDTKLKDLYQACEAIGLQALVEAYDIPEAERALRAGVRLLGINNRNLKNFEVDLAQTERAFGAIQSARKAGDLSDSGDVLLVSESGIAGVEDARHVRSLGADAMLVGEHLMRHADIQAAVRALLGR